MKRPWAVLFGCGLVIGVTLLLRSSLLDDPPGREAPIEGSIAESPIVAPTLGWLSFDTTWAGSAIYEPSAVEALPDGRFLVAQDEAGDPFVLLSLPGLGEGSAIRPAVGAGLLRPDRPAAPASALDLSDLEGLARAADGYLFAITSHSQTEQGERRIAREKLARLRIEGDTIVEYGAHKGLREEILAAHPELEAAMRSKNSKGRKGFSIEALAVGRDGHSLWIGLRGPIIDGDAWIIVLENPNAVFEDNAPPSFGEPLRLDLDKGGIRALSFVPPLDGYVLVSQRADKKDSSDEAFELWFWRGGDSDEAEGLDPDGLDLRKTEGVTLARHQGEDYLLLVSDDGEAGSRHFAHYRLLPLSALAD